MIPRARQINIMPVCAPAQDVEELRFQIDFLLEQYERYLLKAQLEEIHK